MKGQEDIVRRQVQQATARLREVRAAVDRELRLLQLDVPAEPDAPAAKVKAQAAGTGRDVLFGAFNSEGTWTFVDLVDPLETVTGSWFSALAQLIEGRVGGFEVTPLYPKDQDDG